nr:MAG TPA_asm: DNA directed DNA polymerase [Caudoviricetes sp.]
MSVLNYEEFLSKLSNVHKRADSIVAACPVCGDSHHLYVDEKEGKILAYCQKCHASLPKVLNALGINQKGSGTTMQQGKAAPPKPMAKKDHGKLIENYPFIYRDPNGKESYRKIRKKWADGHKAFSFVSTGPDGSVQYRKPDNSNNLYNLDRLAAAKKDTPLYIVEGEKCADAMTKAGFLATSTNTGAQENLKLSDTDKEYLAKFPLKIVLPDNDEAGMKYAKAWERNFGAKVFPWADIWPDMKPKQDIADYLEAGKDPEQIHNYKFPTADFSEEYFLGLDKAGMIQPELFAGMNAIDDPVERQQAESLAAFRAKELGISREFQKNYKAWRISQAQANQNSRNTTKFSGQSFSLNCGDWIADDTGVKKLESTGNGNFRYQWASPIPIMPTEILINQETNLEKIRLGYHKPDGWKSCIVPREIAANASKIVTLANVGVEVNSDNAKNLVKYLAGCVALNPATLPRTKSVSHMGWVDKDFVPYSDELTLDSTDEYGTLINSITSKGTLEEWLQAVKPLMSNLYLRLAISASLSAPLIKPLGALSYAFHLWGGTGAGKTVGLMVAASVWGNPAPGRLLQSMNNTTNFTTGCTATLGNLPFFGDELQTIKTKFNDYDQFIHQITAEVSRGRMDQAGHMQQQKSWKTAFLFTGEEPISQTTSGGGVENRLIEIECEKKVVENGPEVVQAITEQYGTLGPAYIDLLQENIKKGNTFRHEFNGYHQDLLQWHTTEKQAMAMGVIMTADDIFRRYFAPDLPMLKIADVVPFLKTTRDVDPAERAYKMMVDIIAQNKEKFYYSYGDYYGEKKNHVPTNETWGKMKEGQIWINKTVLEKLLQENGFSFRAVAKKWAAKGKLEPTKQGKMAAKLSINGTAGYFVQLSV